MGRFVLIGIVVASVLLEVAFTGEIKTLVASPSRAGEKRNADPFVPDPQYCLSVNMCVCVY